MTFRRPTRRRFLGTSAAALAATGLYAPAVHAQARTVRVGYVTPQTGPLAAFAEVDQFIIDGVLQALSGGIQSGGNTFTLEVIVKDSQSNPNRAAEVAKELIVDDEIDIMLVGNTPETTNPVSTICEIEEIPSISSLAPWQPWFIGRQGNPGDPGSWTDFNYTYHAFWGLEDVIAVFTNMWKQLDTNMTVGGLFPNDADGNAWGDPNVGFPPPLNEQGFTLVDPGRPLPADYGPESCGASPRSSRRPSWPPASRSGCSRRARRRAWPECSRLWGGRQAAIGSPAPAG